MALKYDSVFFANTKEQLKRFGSFTNVASHPKDKVGSTV